MKKYLETGKIVSIHGVRGEVNVQVWCDSPAFFCKLKTLYTKDGASSYNVERARPKNDTMAILKVRGIDTADGAQALRNTVLYMDRADAKLPEGTYFIADLIGLDCVTEAGESLGRLTDVLETGANDVYEITKNGKKYYIPAIPSVVISTDIENGKMTIYPMEGLFDEN